MKQRKIQNIEVQNSFYFTLSSFKQGLETHVPNFTTSPKIFYKYIKYI